MKNLLFFLILCFYSFNANAFTVKTLYNHCEKYRNTGYEKITPNGLICLSFLRGLALSGFDTCKKINNTIKGIKKGSYLEKRTEKQVLGYLRDVSRSVGNEIANDKKIVISFMNWADENIDSKSSWEFMEVVYLRERFLGRDFPCKLE